MSVGTISQLISSQWPITENKLNDYTSINYETEKGRAIERAKRELFGSRSIPADEDDIAETARLWIADRALILLIPMGIDYYMQQVLSDTKREETVSYYNKVSALQDLKNELLRRTQESKVEALEHESISETTKDTPAVSHAGKGVDPLTRAMARGPFPP